MDYEYQHQTGAHGNQDPNQRRTTLHRVVVKPTPTQTCKRTTRSWRTKTWACTGIKGQGGKHIIINRMRRRHGIKKKGECNQPRQQIYVTNSDLFFLWAYCLLLFRRRHFVFPKHSSHSLSNLDCALTANAPVFLFFPLSLCLWSPNWTGSTDWESQFIIRVYNSSTTVS